MTLLTYQEILYWPPSSCAIHHCHVNLQVVQNDSSQEQSRFSYLSNKLQITQCGMWNPAWFDSTLSYISISYPIYYKWANSTAALLNLSPVFKHTYTVPLLYSLRLNSKNLFQWSIYSSVLSLAPSGFLSFFWTSVFFYLCLVPYCPVQTTIILKCNFFLLEPKQYMVNSIKT
jgi:hypothetical protein